ncbi:MAG: hypothetical protein JNK72_07325 [Myxococcales bacterium]|nr:hypothetical protein [Myxococcales bacterium]
MGPWWRLFRWTVSLLGATQGPASTGKVARLVAAPEAAEVTTRGVSLLDTRVIEREGLVTLRVFEGYRLRHGPTGAEFAAEVTDGPVRAAVPLDDGAWAFVTDRGLYRAPGFLDALTAVASLPRGLAVVPGSRGRVVLRDALGGLWSTDGRAAPSALSLPGRVVDVVFRSSLRGVAVLEGGAVLSTHDAGQHWLRLARPLGAAWALRATLSGVLITSLDGVFRLDADDKLESAAWPPAPAIDTRAEVIALPLSRPEVSARGAPAPTAPGRPEAPRATDKNPRSHALLDFGEGLRRVFDLRDWQGLAPVAPVANGGPAAAARPVAIGHLPPGAIMRRSGDGYEWMAPTEGLSNNFGPVDLWMGQRLDAAGRPRATRVWVGRGNERHVGFARFGGVEGMYIVTREGVAGAPLHASFVPWSDAAPGPARVPVVDGAVSGEGAETGWVAHPDCPGGSARWDAVWLYRPRHVGLRARVDGVEFEPTVTALAVRVDPTGAQCLEGVVGGLTQPRTGPHDVARGWTEATNVRPFVWRARADGRRSR